MSVQTQIDRISGEVTAQSSLIKQIASGLGLDPFALTASNWSVWGNASAMTINEDSISLVKASGNSNYMTCLHRFTRKDGTYSFSVKGDGVVQNNAVATIVQIFDAAGNEITETGHYVPNHSYTYSTAYEGFAMNTSYGSFTFTLSEDVSYFVMKFAPGGLTAVGDTVVISDFTLTEPGGTSTSGTPIEKNTSELEEISGAVSDGKYIVPSGEKEITENGTHDVKNYESVNVNVESSGGGASVETCTVTFDESCLSLEFRIMYTTIVDGVIRTMDFSPLVAGHNRFDIVKNTAILITDRMFGFENSYNFECSSSSGEYVGAEYVDICQGSLAVINNITSDTTVSLI